jgi:hypothetical protein
MAADGKSVNKEILLGKRGNSPTPSRKAHQWPNIPEPTQEELQLWKSTLLQLYDKTENCTTLRSNHWRWFKYSSRQHSAWNRSQDGKIYQKLKKNWKIWEITDQSRLEKQKQHVQVLDKNNSHPLQSSILEKAQLK